MELPESSDMAVEAGPASSNDPENNTHVQLSLVCAWVGGVDCFIFFLGWTKF